MLKGKTFAKKTKKGSVVVVAQEHYLRDDIWCGLKDCSLCSCDKPLLERDTVLVPDTNVVLHQLDLLEHKAITNVVITSTVLEEVKHRSLAAYNRLRSITGNPARRFYVFSNEHCRGAYVDRLEGESPNDRNDRAIRNTCLWYKKHVRDAQRKAAARGSTSTGAGAASVPMDEEEDGKDGGGSEDSSVLFILLTADAGNLAKARADGITAYNPQEYVSRFSKTPELVDIVTNPESQVEGSDKVGSGERVAFEAHLSQGEMQAGLRAGRLHQGVYHASRDNSGEGYVIVRGMEQSILVKGLDMNRAVEGDQVAVEIFAKEQWSAPSTLLEDDEVRVALDDEVAQEQEKELGSSSQRPTGKVVGIVRRNWRPYCGVINMPDNPKSQSVLFAPQDRRIPLIRITTKQAAALEEMRIIVCIDAWPADSRYPNGHFVRSIGRAGDVNVETEVVLLEHDVPFEPFSQAVLDCLPGADWQPDPAEVARRRDFRHLNVVSIDPPGCTDIDDALHVRVLENGNYEVGVHIADVSFFMRPGTALDQEAAKRSTTVYLSNRRIDMIPALLSSNLCSLIYNQPRYVFSSLWEMTPQAEIVRTEFAKGIIQSKASFMYSEAQLRIDDVNDNSDITTGLRTLNSLAKILRAKRVDAGALMLASPEVRFSLDSETRDPVDVVVKEMMETNSLVEEFMLLANVSVAAEIFRHFPQCAVLRRHPTPPPSNFESLLHAAHSAGLELSTANSKELAVSLDKAVPADNPYLNTLLRILSTRCMLQAVYFSSGTVAEPDFFHYGLATPIYTHFTSPIRRFADVMVHRLLAVSIGADKTYPDLLDKDKVAALTDNMNFRHKMAQHASRASIDLHSIMFFRGKVSEYEAYIVRVRKNAIQVLLPEFGLEGPIYLKPKDPSAASPPVDFKDEECKVVVGSTVLKVFDRIIVQVTVDEIKIQHRKIVLSLVTPHIEGISVPSKANKDFIDDGAAAPPKKKMKAITDKKK